jgi:hypothetical protein
MSRSRRQPIIKDRPRNEKKSTFYWRTVRRVINDKVRMLKYEPDSDENIPEPKEIVNDYDYCDYMIDYRNDDINNKESYRNKVSRK